MRRAIWERSVADGSILFDIAAGCAEVDVVEDIERIHSELNRRHLVDREVLRHCQIRVEEMRSKDTVPANVSDLVQTRRCKRCLIQWFCL